MLQESYLFVLCFSVSNLCSLYLIQKFSLFQNELKRIVRENETMRRNIDWTKSRGTAGNRYPKKKKLERLSICFLLLFAVVSSLNRKFATHWSSNPH